MTTELVNTDSRETSRYAPEQCEQHSLYVSQNGETQATYYGSQARYPPPIPYEASVKPTEPPKANIRRVAGILQVPLIIAEHRNRLFHLESKIIMRAETYEAVWDSVRSWFQSDGSLPARKTDARITT